MNSSLIDMRARMRAISEAASRFFVSAQADTKDGPPFVRMRDTDHYWRMLPGELQVESQNLQRDVLRLVGDLASVAKRNPLISQADEHDLRKAIKQLRASLNLHAYRSWDAEVLNDQDTVLGVTAAGQAEDEPADPVSAGRMFSSAISVLSRQLELIEATPDVALARERESNPDIAKYRKDTVFVMMWIDPSRAELEDVFEAIKECCTSFGLRAQRADEIEHEGVITDRVLSEIRTSEFLIADLTGERPSVYYEVGYAHALGKRVIMYRRAVTKIHFDLASYNCPEYKNVTELRERLTKRLEDATNRRGRA
jgi:hypothetical protein